MANVKIVEKKKKEVEALSKQIEKAEIVLLANYRGITVDLDTKLRREIRDHNGTYQVVRSNAVKRAFAKLDIAVDEDIFEGPTAIIIADENYLGVLKTIYKFAKENEFYVVKAGMIEGQLKTIEELSVLAQLPSREELLGMLAGTLLSTIQKLAIAVNEVQKVKEKGVEVKEESKEEAKEEEVKEETKEVEEVKEEKEETEKEENKE